LWLECDCKGGAEHETKNLIHLAAARRRTAAHARCSTIEVASAPYRITFLKDNLGATKNARGLAASRKKKRSEWFPFLFRLLLDFLETRQTF